MWILLALKDGPKHMLQIKQFIAAATHDIVTADDQSMYRALRRYYESELVIFNTVPGDNGPERKEYALTPLGRTLLNTFTKRNIVDVYYQPHIKLLLEKI